MRAAGTDDRLLRHGDILHGNGFVVAIVVDVLDTFFGDGIHEPRLPQRVFVNLVNHPVAKDLSSRLSMLRV